MPEENTPAKPAVKITEAIFDEFLKLHSEEELIRIAHRAKRTKRLWLHDLIQAEIRDRTPE